MKKTVLITGSTDGIGLETAKILASQGHHLLVHGRNAAKLEEAERAISTLPGGGKVESYLADLSNMADVEALAKAVSAKHAGLDVLINNAGVFKVPDPMTPDGLDVRFAVNTVAPYLLTERLLPLMNASGRVVNLSSAAQAAVDLDALAGKARLNDMSAYSQSKLAITMWSHHMAATLSKNGPAIIAVNPGSMLGTKMVKQAFGVTGGDLRVGADILCRAALSDEFADASGHYFDNDSRRFTTLHPDTLNPQKTEKLVNTIEAVIAKTTP